MKYSRKCLVCGKEVVSSNMRTFVHEECKKPKAADADNGAIDLMVKESVHAWNESTKNYNI